MSHTTTSSLSTRIFRMDLGPMTESSLSSLSLVDMVAQWCSTSCELRAHKLKSRPYHYRVVQSSRQKESFTTGCSGHVCLSVGFGAELELEIMTRDIFFLRDVNKPGGLRRTGVKESSQKAEGRMKVRMQERDWKSKQRNFLGSLFIPFLEAIEESFSRRNSKEMERFLCKFFTVEFLVKQLKWRYTYN